MRIIGLTAAALLGTAAIMAQTGCVSNSENSFAESGDYQRSSAEPQRFEFRGPLGFYYRRHCAIIRDNKNDEEYLVVDGGEGSAIIRLEKRVGGDRQ